MKIFESFEKNKRLPTTILLMEDKEAALLHAMIEFAALHPDNKRKKTWKKLLVTFDEQLSVY